MYKLSTANKLEQLLLPTKASVHKPNLKVQWCFYHVPKTAGSSLRQSFTLALGEKAVFGVYRNTGASDLAKGSPIWVPRSATVLFGHFPTHAEHAKMFPHAKRVTWIREPLERVWSLLGHYLAMKEQSPQYLFIKEHYIDKGITKKEAIFERMIKENTFKNSVNVYSHYFKHIPLTQFDFVGSVTRNSEDVRKLQTYIGSPLQETQENVRNSINSFPTSLRFLENELASEYEIVGDFL